MEDVEILMEEYRGNIRALFDDKSPDFVNNSSPRHAAILIEEMVSHAGKFFYAFAGRMNPAVWNEKVMAALADANKRGVKIELLVETECDPIKSGIMPRELRGFVRKCGDALLARAKNAHFATGDGKSLRLEMDSERKTAVFAAENAEFAQRAAAVFEDFYEEGTAYA